MFSKKDILRQLSEMHAPQNSVVLIHSSLKAIGETEGRGEGLLEALIEYFTADGGLLCIPTHTWANIDDPSKITLDLAEPQTCIGTLPLLAAKHPKAVRSLHPTHSMAVFGKGAADFAKGEELQTTPANPSGCYGKIFDQDGYILLVGVGHQRNTYLHCVEEMLDVPNRLAAEARPATVRFKDGTVKTQQMHPHRAEGIGDVSLRYPKLEDAFRYYNCIVDGKIGNADAQLCSARGMKAVFEQVYIKNNREELFYTDMSLDPALYME